jgi:maltooligosyltrehalose trehalohydrolase
MTQGEEDCGAIPSGDGAVRWRVWAPDASNVELVLLAGDRRKSISMTPVQGGYFEHEERHIAQGQRYAFSLNHGPDVPDPASRWQPDGVSRPSAVVMPGSFSWSNQAWSGIARKDLVFYELHVGTFTAEGTFEAVIPRLPALRELGVTAIELMPVGQFSGTRNWGYDGVHPFAPQHSYGGPAGLQRLVDACHEQGLACFLDVVYNHVGPEGAWLWQFGPYFTDHYRTPWGRAVNFDGPGSDAVRAFVLANVRMWLEDYHMDGLRLDAVHAIYDFGARHILRAIKETADAAAEERGYPAHIIAESDLNDVRIVQTPDRGGYGLDAQWSDDFHHVLHAFLTGERHGYYVDYGEPSQFVKTLEQVFLLDGCYSRSRNRSHGAPVQGLPGDRFVCCIQNHDQIGNRAAGERLSVLLNPAQQRLAASLLLLAPYLPLLFMGEEYGESQPFQFFCSFEGADLVEAVRQGRKREFEAFHAQGGEVPDPQAVETFERSRVTWDWSDPRKAALRSLYQDLLSARRAWPPMKNYSSRTARLDRAEGQSLVLHLTRGTGEPDSPALHALWNLTSEPARFEPPPGVMLWTSESARYGGSRRAEQEDPLLPYESCVFGATGWKSFL